MTDDLAADLADLAERAAAGTESAVPVAAVVPFARTLLAPLGLDLPTIKLDLPVVTNDAGQAAAGYYDRATRTVHLVPEAALPSVISHELAHSLCPEPGHGPAFLIALRRIYRSGCWHFDLAAFDAALGIDLSEGMDL